MKLKVLGKIFIILVLLGLYLYLFGIKSFEKYKAGGVVINKIFLKDPATRIKPGIRYCVIELNVENNYKAL